MNKNIRAIYDQVAQECIDECDNPYTKTPSAWQWEEKYAKAIIMKCLDMMPLCPEHNHIKYFFGLDTPEEQYKRFIALEAEKLKANKWKTVLSSKWTELHEKFIGQEAIESSHGIHCYDVTYQCGDMLYNMTYSYDHPLPIDVRKKQND